MVHSLGKDSSMHPQSLLSTMLSTAARMWYHCMLSTAARMWYHCMLTKWQAADKLLCVTASSVPICFVR